MGFLGPAGQSVSQGAEEAAAGENRAQGYSRPGDAAMGDRPLDPSVTT